jgi:hypothetical protein
MGRRDSQLSRFFLLHAEPLLEEDLFQKCAIANIPVYTAQLRSDTLAIPGSRSRAIWIAFAGSSGASTRSFCTTRVGKYVFTANTGSKTISRLIGTGSHVFVDSAVAAAIATGGAPADIDAARGVLGVIDHGAGQSHVSLFTYNEFGELTVHGTPITVGVADANGVAILATGDRDRH